MDAFTLECQDLPGVEQSSEPYEARIETKRLKAPIPTAPEVGVTQHYSPTVTEILEADHDADLGSPINYNLFRNGEK